MRPLAVVSLLVALAGVARAASYEMITFVDNNSRVVRYDPVNQLVLGSFGSGYYNGAYGITSVANRSMVWDYNQNRTFVFDTSTGVLQTEISNGAASVGGTMSELSSGAVVNLTSTNVSTAYSPTGSVLFQLPAWAANAGSYFSVAETSTHYYQFSAPINSMRRFRKSDLVNDLNWTNANLSGGTTNWDTTMIRLNGVNRMVLPNRVGNNVRLLDADSGGALGLILPDTTEIRGVTKGHGDILYFATQNATRTRIIRYNYVTGFQATVLDVPLASYQIESMSVVLAPEPGSLATLGLAMLYLLRRKETKRS
jgi:hypothetical protein